MTTERQTPAAKQVMTKCKQCDANELAAHEEMAMPPIWHQYIHVKNIIHRDLKPSNVLLTIEDTVKLTDFGLSRQHNAESVVRFCGTPYYMSPERILEEVYTTKSDIWSLGCILYEMTLRSPIFGEKDNISSLMQKILAKNLIVHSDAIFNARVPGPWYEKYALEATDGGGTPAGDISAELELFVDDEVPSADVSVAAQPTALDKWASSTRQQQLHKRLSSVDLPFPPPSPQFHRFHPQLQSPVSASPPQQQQHYQRLPFLANHHNQQKQQHQVITETSSGGVVGQQDNSSSGANATSSLMDWSLCNAAGSRIIHRDLKPSNVLLTIEDTVKLTDFGLSRQHNAESRVQTVCGTPYYMSPERILEETNTTQSDV
uniref:non-specific serine/threonine protein kinase n=1 Tax=Globodera pallida TaxID=36090 RepID=A0A183CQ85_GLOPA